MLPKKIQRFEEKLPTVSIVITTWNRIGELKSTLTALEKIDYPNIEVVIVDNHSTDGTAEMIAREFPLFRLISLPHSGYGPCESMNIGFENCHGDYVVVLDDDSYPESNAIRLALDEFEKDPALGIIAFRIVNPETGELFTSNWNTNVFSFWGCGAIMRKDVMRKVGYYDSDFFTYANEEDLAIRVLNAGFKLKYMSNLVVYHKLVSKKKGWGKEIYYGGRNRFWICVKYFPLSKLSIAILRLFIKWGYFAFRKRELLNYFRGMLSGLRNIPQMRLKRQIIRHEVVKTLFDWQVYSTIYNKPILVILYNEIKRLISNVVS